MRKIKYMLIGVLMLFAMPLIVKAADTEAPSKPTISVTLQNNSSKNILVQGGATDNVGISKYIIKYGTSATTLTNSATETTDKTTFNHVFSDLNANGTTYYFQVCAYDTTGNYTCGDIANAKVDNYYLAYSTNFTSVPVSGTYMYIYEFASWMFTVISGTSTYSNHYYNDAYYFTIRSTIATMDNCYFHYSTTSKTSGNYITEYDIGVMCACSGDWACVYNKTASRYETETSVREVSSAPTSTVVTVTDTNTSVSGKSYFTTTYGLNTGRITTSTSSIYTSSSNTSTATTTTTTSTTEKKETTNDKIDVTENEKVDLGKTVTDPSKYKWSSSDEDIATVDENGKVTFKKSGSVVITAESSTEKIKTPVTAYVTSKSSSNGVSVLTNDKEIELKAEKISEENQDYKNIKSKIENVEKMTLYDVTMLKNNAKVQPDGEVVLEFDIPAGYDKKKIAVFRVEDSGALTRLDAKIVNGKIQVKTSHFSYYVVAQLSNETGINEIAAPVSDAASSTEKTTNNPKTGQTISIVVVSILTIAATTIYLYTKKKNALYKI